MHVVAALICTIYMGHMEHMHVRLATYGRRAMQSQSRHWWI